MPWKEHGKVDERIKFVARIMDGERMTELCKEFGISRKTGYKIWNRYQDVGVLGFTDRSRRPIRNANQLPLQIEKAILAIKQEKPNWGAPKIRERLARKFTDFKIPAKSTVHAVLDRNGLVSSRKRRRYKAEGTYLSLGKNPNDLWCADFKGQFRLGNQQYCYPLTVTDYASRYVLCCESLESTKEVPTFPEFERVFKDHGLPRAIRTDNGVPFSSPHSLFGLSKLSVWWLRLGIAIERIKPGNPQQNGRHERMHLTLKKETTRPPGQNILQQQAKFDDFMEEFNTERPHAGISMKYPNEVYQASKRPYEGLSDVEYPFHDKAITVTNCGRICFGRLKIHISQALAGQTVGLKEVENGIWLVSFMDYDLGYVDKDAQGIEPLDNPFGARVLPMSPV